jgi:pimeloyl-ACP methyl ester carboxylesterase
MGGCVAWRLQKSSSSTTCGVRASTWCSCITHGAGANWFAPLLDEPLLTGRFTLLHYHRAGYAGSSPLPGPLTFKQEAEIFRGLTRALGIARAHVVGHSASGCIAPQIAIDAADIVQSLALLEPALMAVPSPPEVPKALELYRARRRADRHRDVPSRDVRPERAGAASLAAVVVRTRRGASGPASGSGRSRRAERRAIPPAAEAAALEWLPNVEPFVLPKAGHLLHLENQRGLAEGLVTFFARHPIAVAT